MLTISDDLAQRINDFENNEWNRFIVFHSHGLSEAARYYSIRHSAIVDLMRELGLSDLVNSFENGVK